MMKLEMYFEYNESLKKLWDKCLKFKDIKEYEACVIFLESFIKKILIINLIENIESDSEKWSEIVSPALTNNFEYCGSRIEKHDKFFKEINTRLNLKKLIYENYKHKIIDLNFEKNELNVFLKNNKKISWFNLDEVVFYRNKLLHDWMTFTISDDIYSRITEYLFWLLETILEHSIRINI